MRQTIVMTIRRVLFWNLLAVTILGGVYLGLFACGGFLWHRMLIERTLSSMPRFHLSKIATVITRSPKSLHTKLSRLGAI